MHTCGGRRGSENYQFLLSSVSRVRTYLDAHVVEWVITIICSFTAFLCFCRNLFMIPYFTAMCTEVLFPLQCMDCKP